MKIFRRCPARIKLDRSSEIAVLLRDHDHTPEAVLEPDGEFLKRKVKAISLKICNFSTVFVGTDITDDVEMMTNNKGSTVIFYNRFKYLKVSVGLGFFSKPGIKIDNFLEKQTEFLELD